MLNRNGNSIVQVLVASGIACMLALGVSSLVVNQNKDITALSEKLLSKELELQIKNTFSNADFCNCAFRGKRFNTTAGSEAIVTSDQFTSLPKGYSTGPLDATPCTPVASNLIPPVGSAVAGSNMTVASVGLGNVQLISPGNYSATLTVGFQNSIRSIKDINTSIQFSINPTANTALDRPFVGCATSSVVASTTSIAAKMGLDPNIWPSYINCATTVVDIQHVLTLVAIYPPGLGSKVIYGSGYIVGTSLPVIMPHLRFNPDGSFDFKQDLNCPSQSIQAYKTSGLTW